MEGKKDCYSATIAGFSVQDSSEIEEHKKAQQVSLFLKRSDAALKAKEAANGN